MSLKPTTPKGTRDFSSEVLFKRNYLKMILQKAFESFAFEPLETPSFERLSTLMGKYGDEGDRLIFKILNSGDKLKKVDLNSLENNDLKEFSNSLSEKALRYDLTVPFARYVAGNQNDLIFPFRRYQIQNVWRADRPQHGRFQEFCQCDADIVGDRSLWQEIEMISLYDRVFSDIKLQGVKVKINHRKILEGIVRLIGNDDQLIDFTVAVDKIDKIGFTGVENELISKGFTAGSIKKIKPIINLKGSLDKMLLDLESLFKDIPEGLKGINELRFIFNKINKLELKSLNISFDLTLARGLNYYTGMIIEVDGPSNVKMGSIGGGGRYDNLTSSFGMKNVSGIGISFGFDRLYLILDELNLFPSKIEIKTKILFLNLGINVSDIAFSSLNKLRSRGVICEIYPSDIKMSKQLNYANKKNISFVVIIGDEEVKNEKFTLKNMISGKQNKYPLDDMIRILERLPNI
ncbi:MAG: histidine--tRNA ligase [Flavobacteriaceae bacterium]|nr:histidine--tRNA ligase [Flavobacteriaceae bacterium]